MKHRWLALACLALTGTAEPAPSTYATHGTCGGLPRVSLPAPAGHCVGLVANATSGLRFPRRILEVAPNRFWIIDMGSAEPHQGRLIEMTLAGNQPTFTTLFDKLDRPNGLVKGPEGKVYIGEAHRVWRTPTTGAVRPEIVADKLPNDGLHPLKEMAFDRDNRLFIGIGSVTDACRSKNGEQPAPCPESYVFQPRGAVYVVPLVGPDLKADAIGPYASGLRDSMALAFVERPGVLLQGESSIDDADARTDAAPPDELNVLRYGQHYGWPYCIGDRKPARGYEGRHDCSRSAAPARLWPAHAQPSQMIAPLTGAYAGQLLVAWHGDRPQGHRVVAFTLGVDGLPTGAPRTLLGGSSTMKGVQPLDSPAGLAVDGLGRLWVVEDRNRTLLTMIPESNSN